MPSSTLTVQSVVDAMARSVATLAEAESAFIDSACLTFRAIRGGVSARSIASAAKAAKVTGYTSAAAVLFHARTGAVLMIDGPDVILPGDILAPNVQTMVKALPAADVDVIVQDAETVQDAVDALVKAVAKAARAKASAAKVGAPDVLAPVDESAESAPVEPTESAPVDTVDPLRSALSSVLAFVESGAPVTAEAETLIAEILATLAPMVAPVVETPAA